MTTPLILEEIDTPVGPLALVLDGEKLVAAGFTDEPPRMTRTLRQLRAAPGLVPASAPTAAGRAIRDYFAGDLQRLDDVEVSQAGTPFERAVWGELRRIPCGETRAYRDVARAVGRPKAVRAVGAANGKNPVALVVPCHRVVGADGSLTGYGGGLHRKRWLLAHEAPR